MRKVLRTINALPIKWRITTWISLWMFIFFFLYSSVQYFVLNRWTLAEEEISINKSMNEIMEYYTDNGTGEVAASRTFLEKINQTHQLIRILDANGEVLLTISNGVPEQWVRPHKVSSTLLDSVWHGQEHLLVLRSPINSDNFTGSIEIIRNLENFEKLDQFMLMVMILGGLGGIAFSTFGGVILGRQFVKPIAGLSNTMEKIKYNGLAERVEYIDNKDELSKLSQVFNEMMDRLEESFHQQNQFVEDASHELRTPIAIIEGHLNLLKRWGKDDPAILNESLNASLDELARLKNLTQDLLATSQVELMHIENEHVYPSSVIFKIADDFSIIHPDFNIDLDLQAITGIQVAISFNHLKQIVMIVIDNAIKYSGTQKKIKITGEIFTDNTVQLQIIDQGIGVSPEHIDRVFDRFYRVDQARSRKAGGSGLGLAIAKRLVENYQGSIRLSSLINQGTTITITLQRHLRR
jgi:two-component system sensor histidine kinase ArlS